MRFVRLFCLMLCLMLLSGCSNRESATGTAFLMNTTVTATVYGAGEDTVDEVFDVVEKCENELTGATFENEEALKMLENVRNDSGGLFDVYIGKLTRLWGIGTENERVPDEEEIRAVLTDRSVLDPGAFGKGYACDRIKEYFDAEKVPGACVAVGGSVLCYGSRNGKNGETSEYMIAVRDPDGDIDDYAATFRAADAVVSTSGDYEHVFVADGKKYHHILNPHTGYPVDSGLRSVTVISESGLLSDALSTAAFSLGVEKGRKLLEKYDSEGIFIDKENNIFTTDGVELTSRESKE